MVPANFLRASCLLVALLSVFVPTIYTTLSAQSSSLSQAAEVLNNDSIVKLVSAGLPDQAIVSKIRSSKTAFDLSTDRLIELKGKGVSGTIIGAMLEPAPVAALAQPDFSNDSSDPAVPHYPGVYMLGIKDNRMTRMMATSSNQAKTGGILGYALTMGIASMSVKATIPGRSAKIGTSSQRPVFFMFFDESVPRALQGNGNSIWMSGAGNMTSNPSELSLVRFTEKEAAREARVGSMNIAGAKQGVMDKDQISFEAEQVRPGVFKVTPAVDLAPGQFGFMQALTGGNVSGGGGAMTARVFDFYVAAP
jgi:hypothetical protein